MRVQAAWSAALERMAGPLSVGTMRFRSFNSGAGAVRSCCSRKRRTAGPDRQAWRMANTRPGEWPTQPEPMAAARAFRASRQCFRVPASKDTARGPAWIATMSVRGAGTSTGSRLEITRPSTRTFVGSLKTNFLPAVSSAGRSTAEARARCATVRAGFEVHGGAGDAGIDRRDRPLHESQLVTWGESSTVASRTVLCWP